MDRPKQIPLWAWEEALIVAGEAGQALGAIWGDEQGASAIARAILKAREEAFEEAAKIADGHAQNWTGSRDIETAVQEAAMDSHAEAIASAIRQHSQKGEK